MRGAVDQGWTRGGGFCGPGIGGSSRGLGEIGPEDQLISLQVTRDFRA